MRTKRMISDATFLPGKVLPIRGQESEVEEEKRSWAFRRLHDMGVIEMAQQPARPPGFYVNWSTVTGIIAVLGLIGALFVYVWNTAHQQGMREQEMQTLKERLSKAEDAATKAAQLEAARTGKTGPGHESNTKPKGGN